MLHTSMNIGRYKSGQYNENNFGHTSGERSFPVRHGCHPIHESSLDSRGSYVSDSSEKLNRIPSSPLPRDGLAPSKSVPLAPTHLTDSTTVFLLTLPAGDNDFLVPRKRARAPFTPCTTRWGRQQPVYGIHSRTNAGFAKSGGRK